MGHQTQTRSPSAPRTRVVTACLWIATALAIPAGADETPSERYLLIHQTTDDAQRELLERTITEVVGETAILETIPSGDLVSAWQRNDLQEVRGAELQRCETTHLRSSEWLDREIEKVLAHCTRGRYEVASQTVDELVSSLACLDTATTTQSLQHLHLAQAWAEYSAGESDGFETAMSRAARAQRHLSLEMAELLPEAIVTVFPEFSDAAEAAQTVDVFVTSEGGAIQVHLDGAEIVSDLGTLGTTQIDTTTAPGSHLLQIGWAGGSVESFVLTPARGSSLVELELVAEMLERDVALAVEEALDGREVGRELGAILAAHEHASTYDNVLIGDARKRHGQVLYRILPLNRITEGLYEEDADFSTFLTRVLDKLSGNAGALVKREDDSDSRAVSLRRWTLRVAMSSGFARIWEFNYWDSSLTLGLETPIYVDAEIRPLVGVARDDRTYTYVGAGAFILVAIPYRQLRVRAGFGGVYRGPDHRFAGPRVVPTFTGGFALRFAPRWSIGAHVDVGTYPVHDTAVRVTIERDFGLARKRKASSGGNTAHEGE